MIHLTCCFVISDNRVLAWNGDIFLSLHFLLSSLQVLGTSLRTQRVERSSALSMRCWGYLCSASSWLVWEISLVPYSAKALAGWRKCLWWVWSNMHQHIVWIDTQILYFTEEFIVCSRQVCIAILNNLHLNADDNFLTHTNSFRSYLQRPTSDQTSTLCTDLTKTCVKGGWFTLNPIL